MTFLLIAERELLVATRRRGTYRLRVLAALAALVLGTGFMLIQSVGGSAVSRMGSTLFGLLTWFGFVMLSLAGVFFTSDCVSQEKRQGTLGFLFLTPLRGSDVILGKLLATSLRGSYAVVAVFPVLALTLLMGGVTGTQFWRTCLALLAGLSCSLTAGILVSTLCRDSQNAVSATVLLLLVWFAGGPLVDLVWAGIRGFPGFTFWSYLSPGYAFLAAGHASMRDYFRGMFGNLIAVAALLSLACWLVHRSWQEPSHAKRPSSLVKIDNNTGKTGDTKHLLDENPTLWLALRTTGHSGGAWLVAGIAFLMAAAMVLLRAPMEVWAAWSMCNGALVVLLYLWTASQASRFFVEARQNGMAEVLLGTPLSASQLVDGQWKCLVKTLGPPVLVFLLVQIAAAPFGFRFTAAFFAAPGSNSLLGIMIGIAAAFISGLSSLANLIALGWFGMWSGVTSKSNNIAALKTLLIVQVIPWFIVSFVSGLASMLALIPFLVGSAATGGKPPFWAAIITVAVPASLNVIKDLFFIFWARDRMYTQLRQRLANPIGSMPAVGPRISASAPPPSNFGLRTSPFPPPPSP